MGRPRKDGAMRIDIKFRIDDKTNDILVKYCKEHGKTKTEVARESLKNYLGIKK